MNTQLPACPECSGQGTGVEFVPTRHPHGYDRHWTCETCDGTGVETCDHCDEHADTIRDGDIPLCYDCAAEWDHGSVEHCDRFGDTPLDA